MLAGPSEIMEDVEELLDLRKPVNKDAKTLIIWEPRPSYCTPGNFASIQEAARLVDIFSPNHVKLTAMFTKSSCEVSSTFITEYADSFLQSKIGTSGQDRVVVRSRKQSSVRLCQPRQKRAPALTSGC